MSQDGPLLPVDLWRAPAGAGPPVGCVATSFAFESQFFEQECLPPFLGVDRPGEDSAGGDAAAELESLLLMEDALARAPVTVLVDRSCDDLRRSSLLWDLYPVKVAGGYLHTKVAVLVWSSKARIILGSANLTSAGYHRNLELISSTDIGADATPGWTNDVASEVISEISDLLHELVPDGHPARDRAAGTLNTARNLLEDHPLPKSSGKVRVAAVASDGRRPALDGFARVWPKGKLPPSAATVLSPFWDDATLPAPNVAVNAIANRLSRYGSIRLAVVPDPLEPSICRAPPSLLDLRPLGRDLEVRYFDAEEAEPDGAVRPVHAKAVVFEGADWVVAMVGSSNATTPGLGLRAASHRELNLWLGAPRSSPTGRALLQLITCGPQITTPEVMEPVPDEDELDPGVPELPRFFESAVLTSDDEGCWVIELTFGPTSPDEWSVAIGLTTLAKGTEPPAGPVRIPVADPPVQVTARWKSFGQLLEAPWPVAAVDPSTVPTQVPDVGVMQLLSLLSGRSARPAGAKSTKPPKRPGTGGVDIPVEVDPLKVHVDPSRLIPRVRSHARALARITAELAGPLVEPGTLERRLNGPLGLLTIAQRLADEAPEAASGLLPGEAAFLIAELGWLMQDMRWERQAGVTRKSVENVRTCALQRLSQLGATLALSDPSLADYVRRSAEVAK